MPTNTSFLSLTLPELNEFLDSWNVPVNANFETLDDFLEDMHAALETGATSGTTWATLKGSTSSLAARLAVAIGPDGALDVSGSSDILAMSVSAVHGPYFNPAAAASPAGRMNASDFIVYDARQPVADGRFNPMAPGGPSAGFPPEEIDAGIALRSADFGAKATRPIASPRIPWAPGLVSGGQVPMMSGQSQGVVRISGDTSPAVFNIDGYIFRIREIIDLDWAVLAPANQDYVWVYVERNGANYGTDGFEFAGVGGAFAAKDLRVLQNGTGGSTSASTFQDGAALFNTAALGKIKNGDVLVIESGSAKGSYVIDALDGTTPDTKLTIKGQFPAIVAGGAIWHIQDNNHPNIGAAVTDGDPTTQPPAVDGRVYIGRFRHLTGLAPDEAVTFTRGGVYDSGWQLGVDADVIDGAPLTLSHNLGQVPTQVEIWVRLTATGRVYQPLVERQVVTEVLDIADGDANTGSRVVATLLFPSLRAHTSNTDITVVTLNASTNPAKVSALFTDSAGADQQVGDMRVIARL